MSRKIIRHAVAVLLLLAGMEAALGETLFEKLVMPGEVIKGHAKLEKECKNCHTSFLKEAQSQLCRDCHKPVASDIAERKGYHGRHPTIRNTECRSCHTDHKGRDADIVGLDPQTFRHDTTDFALKGAHAAAPCGGCHKPDKPKQEASSECVACHKKDEPHDGRLGKACDGCHGVVAWLPVKKFDHDKTKFPLKDGHKDVACTACHANEQWKGIETTCVSCHRLKDTHQGRYGAKCENCHAPEKWTAIRFDHDKATKFPLRGEHRKVTCDACHTGDLYRNKLQTTCVSCHKKHDVHQAQLGQACERCHNENSWRQKVAFDHDLTKFPLIGLHAAVPCEGCHVTQNYKSTVRVCSECHKDKHHEGRLGTRCDTCHNPNGWELWRFDHARQTKFPLTGAHTGASCHECHVDKNPTTLAISSDCYSCHNQDDKHRGAFGRACATCHTTTAFSEQMRRR